jgi:dTMP kinase
MIMKIDKGYFLSIEGIDGSGKTTLINNLRDYYQSLGKAVFVTREPGGTPVSEDIRSIILKNYDTTTLSPMSELMLFLASRYQNYIEMIEPLVNQGIIVIADRYHDSTIAYQGAGRELGVDLVIEAIKLFFNGKYPDHTLYLHIDVDTCLQRIKQSRSEETMNHLDCETSSFYEKVSQAYLDLVKHQADRISVIDAKQDTSQVLNDAVNVINNVIEYESKK